MSWSDEFKPFVGVSGLVDSWGRFRDAIFNVSSLSRKSEKLK